MSITANILMFLLSKVFRVTIRYLTIFNSENHMHILTILRGTRFGQIAGTGGWELVTRQI